MKLRIRHAVILAVLAAAGCTDDVDLGDTSSASTHMTANDKVSSDNGTTVNGTKLNGTTLNGVKLNGVSLNGTKLNGTKLNGTSVDGSSLTGAAGQAPSAGAGVVGSIWTGVVDKHTTVRLRIDGAEQGTGDDADLWYYTVRYETSEGWAPLCENVAGAAAALPVAGTWKPAGNDDAHYGAGDNEFTWACRATSVAKCVEMGYRPYLGRADQLASCVRLLRADYCGIGAPNTLDGTLLNLFDNLGLETDTEEWLPEAAWGPDGALCINEKNRARYELVRASQPKCIKKKTVTPDCGTYFPTGAFLIDELPPVSAPTEPITAR